MGCRVADESRTLTWRLLCVLVLALIMLVGYQVGRLQGYSDAAKDLASRPLYTAPLDADVFAQSDVPAQVGTPTAVAAVVAVTPKS